MQEINVADDRKELEILWLGQNSFVLKTFRGTLISIDPYLSRIPRFNYIHPEPPIRPEDLRVDFVFCTHDHLDHTDPDTLSIVAQSSPNTLFLGPKESYHHFLNMGIDPQRAVSLEANKSMIFKDFKVTPLHSIPPEVSKDTTHLGFIFDFNFVTLYNMGDSDKSVVDEPMSVLGEVVKYKPEIVMLPVIGDFKGRKPEDALKFVKILQPKIFIPSHYGCFTNRTIDLQVVSDLFRETQDTRVIIIGYKEKYVYTSYD